MFHILAPLICGPLSTIKAHHVQFNLYKIRAQYFLLRHHEKIHELTKLDYEHGSLMYLCIAHPGTWPMRDCANTPPQHQVQRHSTLPLPYKAGNTNELIFAKYLLCTMTYSMANSCLKINLQRNDAHVFIHHITHPKSSQVMWDYR